MEIFGWLALEPGYTGVEPLAEGAGHLLKTGSERMGGEENRTGARVRAACGALLLMLVSTIVLRGVLRC